MKLKGLYTAVITPFDIFGHLDEEGLRQNLRYQLHHQVQGVVVLGSTGESPTLTHQEKQKIIKIAAEEIKGKALLMVGTGSYSTAQTIEATQEAQGMGADAALIVTPYYNRPTQKGMHEHFKAIARSVSLPICVYNVPGRTGQNLQAETLQQLAEFETIIGVKEASGQITQMMDILEIMRKIRPDFSILSGDDAFTFPLISLGGHGIISVVSNLIPTPMRLLVEAALNGDFETAREWHYQLLPFFKAAFIETNPIPIKTAMQLQGMAAGACRLPLCHLTDTSLSQLKQILSHFPSHWIG